MRTKQNQEAEQLLFLQGSPAKRNSAHSGAVHKAGDLLSCCLVRTRNKSGPTHTCYPYQGLLFQRAFRIRYYRPFVAKSQTQTTQFGYCSHICAMPTRADVPSSKTFSVRFQSVLLTSTDLELGGSVVTDISGHFWRNTGERYQGEKWSKGKIGFIDSLHTVTGSPGVWETVLSFFFGLNLFLKSLSNFWLMKFPLMPKEGCEPFLGLHRGLKVVREALEDTG